jgi:tetratricopeptide (TPR) repeat protein
MLLCRNAYLVVLLTATLTSLSTAADPPESENKKAEKQKSPITSLPKIAPALHEALQNKEYAAAIRLIDATLSKKPTVGGYLLYLKGRAQTELKIYDGALNTFEQLEKGFPKSPWIARSRFGRADLLIRQRNYREAGQIYEAEAKRLLSDGRRDELAGITLEFAERYFEGIPFDDPAAEKKPNYQQALTYYWETLKLSPSLNRRQKIELRIARCLQETKQLPQAVAAYEKFLKQYTSKDIKPEQRASDELVVQARFQRGRAQLAAGQPAEARKTWQDFLTSDVAKKAGGDLLPEAAYRLASTFGVPVPQTAGDLELGVAALKKFLKTYPNHKLAPKAEYEIAQSYIHHGRFEQAIGRLQSLIENKAYQSAAQVAEARYLLGESFFLQKKFTESIAAFRAFLDNHSTNKKWAAVQRRVIDSEFQMAAEQRREKNYDQARKLWETFLNKYPLDARVPGILFLFGQMKYAAGVAVLIEDAKQADKQGEESFDSRDISEQGKKLFAAAIADWRRLVSKYPNTKESSNAAYMVGVTLEDRLGQLADALEAYKKVTVPYQSAAQQQIKNLTAKQLDILTERKFRSNEKPYIKLRTRNVEKVSVKMYRIDMTDYFRKMHLASGVETLDIALIDPDKSWEYSVEDYESYRQLLNDVTIPVDGPGVTAVTVSGEKLEATTMVIVSDLDIIVKSSRNELFVFAENMLTQKPAEGVSLLVSDGKQVFAEELTNAQGILQKSFEQMKTVNDLRVFAVQEENAASSVCNLDGLDFVVGLSPRGYLYTDRPVYRVGQLVNLKGIIRWVNNDTYAFKEGEKYKLDVYDARGRIVTAKEMALNKFGTFADNFTLPETAPLGDYRVHLHQPGGKQSYETRFQVQEYKLEPIQLSVNLKKKVYYRGETIEGKIALKYYYGTPLPDRKIQYQLDDERVHTAKTDNNGEVKFTFDTSRYSESQELYLSVTFPERSLEITEDIYLAMRGFDIEVETIRNVYIGGETFDVTVNVSDPAGEPVGTDLKLEVLESAIVNRKRGERLVSAYQIKADKETGEARQTLRIDKEGRYILRVTGTDQFENPVSGSSLIKISGDDDRVRLRILADKHHHQVGDTANVQLHWRDKPALALVTYEGATILGYRLVELKTGANPLNIPTESKLAPNFVLSVTVMDKNRFHRAGSEFRVERKLKIELKPNNTTFKPGDELAVDVLVTDPQGNPVSAELTLALTQKNLLERFGASQGEINEFFGGGYRQPQVRAFTSITFHYRPKTRGISQYLLAEEERQKILEMELAAIVALQKEKSRSLSDARLSMLTDVPTNRELYIEDMNEVESAAIPFTGRQIQYGQNWEEITSRRRGRYAPDNRRFYADDYSSPGTIIGLSQPDYTRIAGPVRRNGLGGRESLSNLVRQQSVAGLTQRRFGGGGGGGGGGLGGGDVLANTANFGGQTLPSAYFLRDDVQFFPNSMLIKQTESLNFDQKHFLNEIAGQENTIVALNSLGELQVVNGLEQAQLEDLAKQGLHILPGMGSSETGYWNPVVVTGEDGKAKVTFRLPNRSTAWKLQSTGTDAETLTGQAELEIITKKDLFGEMKTPLAFTEGDKAKVLVEVHNSVVKQGLKMIVTLKSTIGERALEQKKTITSSGSGLQEVSFPVEITAGEAITFDLQVMGGTIPIDRSSLTVPIRPYGMPVFATKSGSSNQSTIVFIEHNKNLAVEGPELEILIGPSINRTLLDAVLGGGISICEPAHILPPSGIERSISDVLGGVALLKMIGGSRSADTPEAEALSGRVQSAVSRLVSSQRDDGGWSWSGRPAGGQPHRYLTSRVVWALSSARDSGFAVPQQTFDKGVTYLKSSFTATNRSEREAQTIILHGLAEAGGGDFAFANRLYRERNSLSPAGLLHLTLLLAEIDRKEMAAEVLKLVKIPIDPKTGPARSGSDAAIQKVIPWMKSGVELRALYLLALEAVDPGNVKAAQLAEWLMANRYGSRWIPEKANGPAVAALVKWFGRTERLDEKYTLSVFVNNKELKKLDVDSAADGTRRLTVPAEMLVKGKPQRINFDLEGRGRFSYSVVMGGFVPADKLKSTTNSWRISRVYDQAPRMLDGEEIPHGFGVVSGSIKRFGNFSRQLPLGDRTAVRMTLRRYRSSKNPDGHLDYFVITDPIPAGTVVLTESIKGPFQRYELTAGGITFYMGSSSSSGTIQYSLVGYLPGDYRAVPAVAKSFYQPDRIAISQSKALAVLPRGEKTKDEYKLTPDELYHLGKRLMAKRDYQHAYDHLSNLFRTYRLRSNNYREVVQWLFAASLSLGKHQEIVEYFEIIKERYPDVEIGFADIMKVAKAYQKLGEYERSYLVFRATVEASFQRESRITGFLEARGEFLRSVEVMEQLLRQYPAESYVATATYSLAGEVYGKGLEAASNKKLREAKVSKVDLIAAAIGMLDHFLSTWPEDRASDQAAFSMANAYLDLEQYEAVIKRCEQFSERYPKSKLLDSFWYVIGYSQFALGRHDEALKMCRQVAEATRKDSRTGIELAAANKWQAIYIMGQVYHSLGKPADAISEYERVKNRFPDATEAIDFFLRKQITLPEVTTVKPGDAAKVPLKFRNVSEANVKVYRIDLLKFGLMQRNLNRITAINLAGIRPYHELTLQLGDGKDYRDREQSLDLPLKEEGAYLVVCRGENLYASVLVLVSPLTLQIQEDAGSGRVRVTVKDIVADKYRQDVQVKVIGTSNSKFISGETDLRGIFVADDIRGTSTVIAKSDKNRYAFYRGKTVLGNVKKPDAPAAKSSPRSGKGKKTDKRSPSSQKGQLLENLLRGNSDIQQKQRSQYRKLLENKKEGVKAKGAF